MEVEKGAPLESAWRFYVVVPGFDGGDTLPYVQYGAFAWVADYWAYAENLPPPTAVLSDKFGKRRTIDGALAEGLALFKDGVVPEWEDARNTNGGHWASRAEIAWEDVDEVWRLLTAAAVGEVLEPGSAITGVRLVDKSRGPRRMYRVEVWVDQEDQATIEEIRLRLSENLGIANWVWHSHRKSLDAWNSKKH